jgi:Protein of unknown function (DUF3800)
VILFFVDDSGNTGARLDHPIEQVHWLAAIAVDESVVRDLDRAVSDCCLRFFGSDAHAADFEVKGSELFGGRGCAEKLPPDARIACYDAILALLNVHGVRLFIRGINKPAHAARAKSFRYDPAPPYDLAFQYLAERIDEWLATLPGQPRGLVVADEQQEAGRRMIHQFNQWTHNRTPGGYRARQLGQLLPALHYVRSVDSRLVQLADCVAFLRNRFAKVASNPKNNSDIAIIDLWTRHCSPLLVDDRVWP